MTVLTALTRGIDAVRRNPILLAIAVAVSVVQLPSLVATQLSPTLSSVLSLLTSGVSLLLTPFVLGGLLVASDEALHGQTSFGSFLQAGKTHFLSLLGAYLLFLAAITVLLIVLMIAVIVLAAVGFVALGGGSTTTTVVIGAVGLGAMVLMLVPVFFVQFFGHAIVFDDTGVIGGFKRSAGLVRQNLSTVGGYFLFTLLLAVVSGGLGAIGSVIGTQPGLSPTTPSSLGVTVQAVGLLVVAVVSSVFPPFSVAIYRVITDDTDDRTPSDRATPA